MEGKGNDLAIKAVFFDIDGTLLNDRKNVQQSTQKAIKSLKKQGIFVRISDRSRTKFCTTVS